MRKMLILALLLFAEIAQAQEGVTIAPPPPPPGELVDVGGYSLHLYCVGEGSPTILLEPGFARFSLNMRATQEQLSALTRVCAYDHAGFGWSEPGPLPRTTQQLSDELAALLDNAGIEPPYILIAHSLGGFVARLFVTQHGETVAGVVLLDATPPEFLLDPISDQSDQMLQLILQGTLQVAQSGQWNQQALMPVLTLTNDMPPELRDSFISLATTPDYVESALSEWENRLLNAQQVIDSGLLGDLPLRILVAGDRLALSSDADRLWIQGQVTQAELSTNSELNFVVGGDHSFYISHPDAVVRAVQQFIEGE